MSPEFDTENFNSSPSSQPVLQRSIAKIAEALAKAQSEMVQPEKNKTVTVKSDKGPYSFDYADYNAIVEAVRGPLSKNGIAFTHLIDQVEGGALILLTRLIHSSGECLESVYPLPRSLNPKELGGAITYGKRYCLSAITGCVADDDADSEPDNVTEFKTRPAGGPQQRPASAPKISPPPATQAPAQERIIQPAALSAAQLSRIFAIAAERGWEQTQIREYMAARWNISSSKDLSRQQYDNLIEVMETRTFQQACNGLIMQGEGAR